MFPILLSYHCKNTSISKIKESPKQVDTKETWGDLLAGVAIIYTLLIQLIVDSDEKEDSRTNIIF